jgi:glucosamine kinase
MIVVADSGSTKTDWVIIDSENNSTVTVKTSGFNPYFQTSEMIYQTLEKAFGIHSEISPSVKEVFYYGAGCSSPDKNEIVAAALRKLFPNAAIEVQHDMIAASRSTLRNVPGIACIIGTGSNSCVWNGYEITHNIPSHGYVFGDEGSGAYLGIELLKLFLNNQMSDSLRAAFTAEYNVDENTILSNVYKGPGPNVFLASFAKFYQNHTDFPELREIIENSFKKFFETRIVKYPNYTDHKLGFVGSIAFYFKDILQSVAKSYNMEIETVTKCPIDNLVIFHSYNKILNEK